MAVSRLVLVAALVSVLGEVRTGIKSTDIVKARITVSFLIRHTMFDYNIMLFF